MEKLKEFIMFIFIIYFSVQSIYSYSSFSTPSWQCGSEGIYTCPRDSTCCYDKNSEKGFTCFPIDSGNCCNVGKKELLTACPFGTKCNKELKKCEKNS